MSSAKWQPFCLGLNVVMYPWQERASTVLPHPLPSNRMWLCSWGWRRGPTIERKCTNSLKLHCLQRFSKMYDKYRSAMQLVFMTRSACTNIERLRCAELLHRSNNQNISTTNSFNPWMPTPWINAYPEAKRWINQQNSAIVVKHHLSCYWCYSWKRSRK